MSLTLGQAALIRRIVTMTTDANIVLPNGPGAGLPRYVVQAAGGTQRTRTIDGVTEARPEIVVRVETEAGAYATESDSLVADLVARFDVGDSFDGVTIIERPSPRPPLPVADGVYSVPVIIRGFTSF
jgi:hypothetical protein